MARGQVGTATVTSHSVVSFVPHSPLGIAACKAASAAGAASPCAVALTMAVMRAFSLRMIQMFWQPVMRVTLRLKVGVSPGGQAPAERLNMRIVNSQ